MWCGSDTRVVTGAIGQLLCLPLHVHSVCIYIIILCKFNYSDILVHVYALDIHVQVERSV